MICVIPRTLIIWVPRVFYFSAEDANLLFDNVNHWVIHFLCFFLLTSYFILEIYRDIALYFRVLNAEKNLRIKNAKRLLLIIIVYIYIYEVHTISFQTFFVWAFKIVVNSWTFSMLLLYILWDDRPIFMISGSNEQLQQQLEYTLLKPDCHSWWISKMQSDTLEERYAIKFCLNLAKNATETYGMLQTAFLAWIEHEFLSGIRNSRKPRSLWGMMGGGGGVRKSIHQSWLAKGLGLGLLCWDFKGFQKEIPSEKASTLEIGSVAYPPGQYSSPQLHCCHRLFDSCLILHPPYSPDLAPCTFWLFPKLRGCRYETIEEMKVIDTLT